MSNGVLCYAAVRRSGMVTAVCSELWRRLATQYGLNPVLDSLLLNALDLLHLAATLLGHRWWAKRVIF
jgi:hypothetical protein